jgi:transcriptional regulator with XRE-family HTH domain
MTENTFDDVAELLKLLGERVRLARMRRRWSQAELSERMQVERRTVVRLEQGQPGVSLGVFLTALWVLDLWKTAQDLADPAADAVGIFLEKKREPKRARRSIEETLDF